MSHPPVAQPNPAAHHHPAPWSARAWCEECRPWNGPEKGTLAYEIEELRLAWHAFVWSLVKPPLDFAAHILLVVLRWINSAVPRRATVAMLFAVFALGLSGCVSIVCRERPELSGPCRDPKTGRFVACEASK